MFWDFPYSCSLIIYCASSPTYLKIYHLYFLYSPKVSPIFNFLHPPFLSFLFIQPMISLHVHWFMNLLPLPFTHMGMCWPWTGNMWTYAYLWYAYTCAPLSLIGLLPNLSEYLKLNWCNPALHSSPKIYACTFLLYLVVSLLPLSPYSKQF